MAFRASAGRDVSTPTSPALVAQSYSGRDRAIAGGSLLALQLVRRRDFAGAATGADGVRAEPSAA